MKKIIWLVFIVLVAGCKKEESIVGKVNQNLMGTWSLVSNKMEYYDDAGFKKYEETLAGVDIINKVTFLAHLRATILTEDATTLNTEYNVIKEDNLTYLELYDTAIFDSHIWRIVSVSATNMTWKASYSNIEYENKETGGVSLAARSELNLQFTKQ
jgi:hypothetical protein